MALLGRGSRSSYKPPGGAQINWGNPLAKGLQMLVPFNEGAGNPRDLISKQFGTFGGNAKWVSTNLGPAIDFDGNGDYVEWTNVLPNVINGHNTFFIVFPKYRGYDTFGGAWLKIAASAEWQYFTSTSWYVQGNNVAVPAMATYLTDGNYHTVVMTIGPTGVNFHRNIYVDGTLMGSTSNQVVGDALVTGAKTVRTGASEAATTHDVNGQISLLGMSNGEWTAAQAKMFHVNPFQMLQSNRLVKLGVPSVGGGGTPGNATPAVATGLFSVQTATADGGVVSSPGNATATVLTGIISVPTATANGGPIPAIATPSVVTMSMTANSPHFPGVWIKRHKSTSTMTARAS